MANFNFGEVILNAYLKSQADVKEQERYSQEAQFRERQFQTQVEQYNDNKKFEQGKFEFQKFLAEQNQKFEETKFGFTQETTKKEQEFQEKNVNINTAKFKQGIASDFTAIENAPSEYLKATGNKGYDEGTITGGVVDLPGETRYIPNTVIKAWQEEQSRKKQDGAMEEARRLNIAEKKFAWKEQGLGYNSKLNELYRVMPIASPREVDSTGPTERIIAKESEGMDVKNILFGEFLNKKYASDYIPVSTPSEALVSGLFSSITKGIVDSKKNTKAALNSKIGGRLSELITPYEKDLSYLEELIRKPNLSSKEVQSISAMKQNFDYMIKSTINPEDKENIIGGILGKAYEAASELGYNNDRIKTKIINLKRRYALISNQLEGKK